MTPVRMAVIGAGQFGKNHMRVIRSLHRAELVAAVDVEADRAAAAAAQFECEAVTDIALLAGKIDAAVVAAPTTAHADIGCRLLAMGIDVLIEKPIAPSLDDARRIIAAANGRIVQIGHLEQFNPAVMALRKMVTVPLFFEVHRLSLFTPRSLDVDVVLDLMIHDIDILLALTGKLPEEIRAAGISILSRKVDIANVRLAFPGGCVANLTASRVSTEQVRKLRLFQPHQYVSLDYSKQEIAVFAVSPSRQIGFVPTPVEKKEPLRLELESFLDCVITRAEPLVTASQATLALQVSLEILAKIEEHSRIVAQSLQ
jgi:predicted dehydrogenase